MRHLKRLQTELGKLIGHLVCGCACRRKPVVLFKYPLLKRMERPAYALMRAGARGRPRHDD
eukprot:333756-Pyramimonas_sp.AAC.1